MFCFLLGPTTSSKYFAKPSVHRAFGSHLDLPLWNLIAWSSSWIFSRGRWNKTFAQHLTDTFGPAPATRTETHFKHHKVLVPNIAERHSSCRRCFYSTLRSKGRTHGPTVWRDTTWSALLLQCRIQWRMLHDKGDTHTDISVTLGWVRQCASLFTMERSSGRRTASFGSSRYKSTQAHEKFYNTVKKQSTHRHRYVHLTLKGKCVLSWLGVTEVSFPQ